MKRNIQITLIGFTFILGIGGFAMTDVLAAEIRLGGILPGGGIIQKKVTSIREARYRGIIEQKTDFSCGAAAVATMLKYGYAKDVNEEDVLKGMMQVSDPARVREKGFSLLEMKKYVQKLGMRGRGYRMNIKHLSRLKIPTIVLLDTKGYKHFVVLKKATNREVYLADPSRGNKTMTLEDFEASWNGIVFAVIGKGYDQSTILRASAKPLSVKRLSLRPTIWDARVYEFGFAHANFF